MNIGRERLLEIIKEEVQLHEAEKEKDADFDPDVLGGKMPPALAKLLDPDLKPQEFAKLDAKLDDTGKPEHQSIALVAYAMTYADNDIENATKLLQKAVQFAPKLASAMEAAKEGDSEESDKPKE